MSTCAHCAANLTSGATTCPSCGRVVAPAGAGAWPSARTTAPRRPAGHWLGRAALGIVGFLLLGCLLLLIVGSVPNPVALWVSTGAAIVPALFYSLLVLAIDRHEREPWQTLLGAFGWGAVVATLFSLLLDTLSGHLLSAAYGAEAGYLLNIGLGAPLIEESMKGIALLLLLRFVRAEFDNLLDGLVYGALIGLGFAMTENVLYFGQAYLTGGLQGLSRLFVARAVLGGFGHALYTGTTGAAVGWARGRHGRGLARFIVPVLGWGLAVFQHFLWNSAAVVLAALRGQGGSLISLVLIEAVLLTLPGLLALFTIAQVAGRRELAIIRAYLADEVTSGVLTQAEYNTLWHSGPRWSASLAAWREGGLARWLLQQRFFQAAAELAFRKYHLSHGERPKGEQLWTPEQEYRARLALLRRRLGEREV